MKFKGKVIKGNQRGKAMGFPTANIDLSEAIPEGIYISKVNLEKDWYPALIFVGAAKTFDEEKIQAETYILDFNSNLYNQWISVELIKKIRGNRKFRSEEELVRQMKKDELVARSFFNMLV